jgi:hypothetical protein
MELSGCKALQGCDLKNECYRYILFLQSTPYKDFNAIQTCRLSHFTKKKYLHFIPIEEFFLLNNQDYGR